MAGQQARVERIERSLRRLGFHLSKVGRGFKVTDNNTGELAVNSGPKMSLVEIELWIGEFIKPKRA